MVQDPLTLYKLIILYMLNKVSFPLTTAQISEFILDKEYTNFLTLQQILGELTEAGMITAQTIRNRTHLRLTKDGAETLHYFENRINDAIKDEILSFFQEKEYSLRNEVSILADYYKSTSGEFEAKLIAKEKDISLIDLTISVPTEELASTLCDNWEKKNQEIYEYIIQSLL